MLRRQEWEPDDTWPLTNNPPAKLKSVPLFLLYGYLACPIVIDWLHAFRPEQATVEKLRLRYHAIQLKPSDLVDDGFQVLGHMIIVSQLGRTFLNSTKIWLDIGLPTWNPDQNHHSMLRYTWDWDQKARSWLNAQLQVVIYTDCTIEGSGDLFSISVYTLPLFDLAVNASLYTAK